jgi:hypothetical protein
LAALGVGKDQCHLRHAKNSSSPSLRQVASVGTPRLSQPMI